MYFRKVIHIRAEDSPNVALALAEQRMGRVPSDTQVLPGVLTWAEYQRRRSTWDKIRQCVSLDGQFYEGGEVLLFPPDWLNLCHKRDDALKGTVRKAKAIGCDTAEGGDNTAWAVTDEHGLMYLESCKTPNTAVITGRTIALMQQYGVKPEAVMFDRGGGGKQHVDRLNEQGYRVSTVMFGETVTPEQTRYLKVWEDKQDERKELTTFKNRRAQMYWHLRTLIDPFANEHVFAIPAEYTELRRQLAPVPVWYDEEGKFILPPKRKRSGVENSNVKTIQDMIGCSPDESDALVLACHAMDPSSRPVVIRPMF